MKFSTFGYSLHQGLKNIRRNKMFSVASMATMAACIFLFSLFYSVTMNFTKMVKEAEAGVAVTVFFKDDATDARIEEIGKQIKSRAEVSEVKYVSAEEALDSFIKDYLGEDNKELIEGFKQDNPLADSDNYEVYLNDVSMQSNLVTYIESMDGVREVNHSEVAAKTLASFNKLVAIISGVIIVILLCVAVFLISNTVTIGISVRKEEISIMKLIGATDSFVRAPFVVEGIIIGIIGAIVPLALFFFLYDRVIAYVSTKFSILNSLLQFVPVGEIYKTLVPIAIVLAIGIGFLGSYFTVKKHVRV